MSKIRMGFIFSYNVGDNDVFVRYDKEKAYNTYFLNENEVDEITFYAYIRDVFHILNDPTKLEFKYNSETTNFIKPIKPREHGRSSRYDKF